MTGDCHPRICELVKIRNGDVIAVIGAGGKHTLMYRLSQELVAAGKQVVLTSTTNLQRSAEYERLSTLLAADHASWPKQLKMRLPSQQCVVLAGSTVGPGLYKGVDPGAVARIATAVPQAVLLVKADGARKRLVKVPAEHEPVWPERVDVCILVLSLDAIGKPLTEKYVHRVERVRSLAHQPSITAETLSRVINGPGGYAQRLLSERSGAQEPGMNTRNVLYLSSCASASALNSARVVSRRTQGAFHQQIAGDTITGRFFML